MTPMFFVLAILGCGDDQAQCETARVEQVRYATMAQCNAALPAALSRNADLSYPVISGVCRTNGMQMASTATSPQG